MHVWARLLLKQVDIACVLRIKHARHGGQGRERGGVDEHVEGSVHGLRVVCSPL